MGQGNDRATARWFLIGLCVLAAIWYVGSGRVALTPGETAPAAESLAMLDSESRPFSLSDYRGRVVLVALWADWCGPCRREAKALTELQREFGEEELVVVGLNADGMAPEALSRIKREWGMGYRVGSPAGGLAADGWNGPGVIPHSWFIDRKGRLRGEKSGALPLRTLRRTIRKLTDEASDAAS